MSYSEGLIDLTNYSEKDLLLKPRVGSTLSIQTEGNVNLTVTARHSELEGYGALACIKLEDLSVVTNISSAGLYVCSTGGMDQIKLNVSGTGKIHWKEIGD